MRSSQSPLKGESFAQTFDCTGKSETTKDTINNIAAGGCCSNGRSACYIPPTPTSPATPDKTCTNTNAVVRDGTANMLNQKSFDCSVEPKMNKELGAGNACADQVGGCTAVECCTRDPYPACKANVNGKVPFTDTTKPFELCICGDRAVSKYACSAGSSCIGNVCTYFVFGFQIVWLFVSDFVFIFSSLFWMLDS